MMSQAFNSKLSIFVLGEAKVRQVLGEQDSWLKPKLLSWKLELFRRSPLTSTVPLSPEDLILPLKSRIFILFLAVLVVLASSKSLSFIEGKMLPANVGAWLPKDFRYFDLITLIVPLALGSYYNSIIAIVNNKKHWSCILCWLTVFLIAILESYQVISTEFRVYAASLNLASTMLVVFEHTTSKKSRIAEKQRQKRQMILKQEATANGIPEETEVSSNPTPNNGTPTPPLSSNNTDLYLPNHEIYQRPTTEGTNQFDISTLQINSQQTNGLGGLGGHDRPTSPFSIKKYNAANSTTAVNFDDFGNKSFMKPAKFVYNQRNRVAQSSWVAGGYWHNNAANGKSHKDNMSRSSSISSGIGSISSAAGLQLQQQLLGSLPNSRVNSTCGDNYERFSVFSEPAKFHNPMLSFVNNSKMAAPAHGNSVMNGTIIRSRSVLGDDDDENNSFDSSLERLTQEAFDGLRPKAESSPKNNQRPHAQDDEDISFLERKITVKCSVYSVMLFFSVAFNVSLSLYFASLYV